MTTEPQYIVLGAASEGLLSREVGMWLDRGYSCVGGVSIGKDGRFHQAVAKRSTAPVGEIKLREPKRR